MTSQLATTTQELHRRSILIDGRDPTFLLYRQTRDEKSAYWSAIEQSGLTAITVDVPQVEDDFKQAAMNFGSWHERVAAHPDTMVVRSGADIQLAKQSGRVGFILSAQSPTPIENDLGLLRALYDLGLRVMEMSYNKRNLLADGWTETNDGGVSKFGLGAIAEMNRLGIAIDLSHASDRTMIQTIEASVDPVYFSHSNARGKVEHGRNVPDAYLKALVERDGICCVSALSDFLKVNGGKVGTTLVDYVDMMKYVVDIVGVDHAGIGFDVGEARNENEVAMIGGSDPKNRYVAELKSRTNLVQLTGALLKGGFSEQETQQIMGGNLLRFFGRVWDKAS